MLDEDDDAGADGAWFHRAEADEVGKGEAAAGEECRCYRLLK